MLFYEPLFLTVFPAVYAFYLLVTGAPAKKWTLLVASTLFYLWGEPVFVLVLFVSTAVDYALSFHLDDATPQGTRRLALTAGIAGNLAVLVVYKYADFLADNFNLLLAPLGSRQDSSCCIWHCRSACRSSCSKRSPIWWTPIAARPVRPRRSPTTACSCCSFQNCWRGRSSNITR